MNYETYSHNMLDSAIKDFHSIAAKNEDMIGLADVLAYQQNGNAAQKQVGQFLLNNYDTLRDFDDTEHLHSDISLDNLKTADLYTSSDKGALKKIKDENLKNDEIKDTAIAAAVGTAVMAPIALLVPPMTPLAVGSVAVFVGGAALVELLQTKSSQSFYADTALKLHP